MSKESKDGQEQNAKRKLSGKTLGVIGTAMVVAVAFVIGVMVYVSPDSRLARQLDLGQKYLEELDYEQAVVAFEQAIDIDPMNVEAYLGLAAAYEGMGDMESAFSALDTCYGLTEDEAVWRQMNSEQYELVRREHIPGESAVKEVREGTRPMEEALEEEESATESSEETEESIEEIVEKGAVRVDFENILTDSLEEYAILTGVDADGDTVWTYQTGQYMITELTQVGEFGLRDNTYYFYEGGTVKALNLADGEVIWENNSFGGAGAHCVFGDDGSLYLCGYYGPDFFAIDKDGNTLKRIERIDERYWCPYQVEYLGDRVAVTFGGGDAYSEEPIVFYVNLNDFSYYYNMPDDIGDVEQYEGDRFSVRVENTYGDTIDTFSSYFVVTLKGGTVAYEDLYYGRLGGAEIGDLTGDGQDDILFSYFWAGANGYVPQDVFVYTIEGTNLVKILDSEEKPDFALGLTDVTGASIENGCLRVEGVVDNGKAAVEWDHASVLLKYQDEQWGKVD